MFFLVNFFFFSWRFFFLTIFILYLFNWFRFLGLLWKFIENIFCGFITFWITIKNITTILTIILIESPSDSFID